MNRSINQSNAPWIDRSINQSINRTVNPSHNNQPNQSINGPAPFVFYLLKDDRVFSMEDDFSRRAHFNMFQVIARHGRRFVVFRGRPGWRCPKGGKKISYESFSRKRPDWSFTPMHTNRKPRLNHLSRRLTGSWRPNRSGSLSLPVRVSKKYKIESTSNKTRDQGPWEIKKSDEIIKTRQNFLFHQFIAWCVTSWWAV